MSLRTANEDSAKCAQEAKPSNQGCDVGNGATCAEPGYYMPEILKSCYNRRQELTRQQHLLNQRLMVVNSIIDAFGG